MLSERSCRGFVRHARGSPHHAFRYPVWMVYVDLDPGKCGDRRVGMAATRRRLLSAEAVRSQVRTPVAGDEVRVFALTQPRSLAGSFNPVNFYFCWSGTRLAAVLLQVTNTPWRERHNYVLEAEAAGADSYRFGFDKRLHVSPFLPMDGRYAMRVTFGADSLRLTMAFDPRGRRGQGRAPAGRAGASSMAASLALRHAPLTSREAWLGAVRHPLQNGVTLARIYRQAARLHRLGATFHWHPKTALGSAPVAPAPVSMRKPPGGTA